MPGAASRYRDQLREFGKSLSGDVRLQDCGKLRRKGGVGAADEILYVRRRCGRVLLCPVCGHYAANDRCEKLADALLSWTAQGGLIAILTSTIRHDRMDELSVSWGRLDSGWGTMTRSSCWRTAEERSGVRGYVRITEIDHYDDTGWHPHFHTLLLINDLLDDDQLYELKGGLVAAFMRGVQAAGGQALPPGQDLKWMDPGGERGLASYYSKGTRILRSEKKRTPMAILADLERNGENFDLWQEFSATVAPRKGKPRRRCYSPSPNIQDLRVNRP